MNGTKGTAAVFLLSTLVFTVVLAAPAMADESCVLLDPSCVVDTVEEAVVDATETVGEVTDTVDRATETANEIVDDTTNGVDDVVDDTVGGGGGDPGEGGNGGGQNGGGGGRGGGGTGGDDPNGAARPPAVRPAVIVTPADVVSISDITPNVGVASRDTGSPERRTLGLALVPLVTSVIVMLLLLGLVAGFVTFQHALDRRDPKLAPDTLGSDRIPFA
jgi:hypothetical protein